MKEIKIKSIKELKRGDIVRNIGNSRTYIIDNVYENFAIGMRTVNITNPNEWVKIDLMDLIKNLNERTCNPARPD